MTRPRAITTLLLFIATFGFVFARGGDAPGLEALWPSALAVGLAFLTRNIHLSLFIGAFAGAVLLRSGNPVGAFLDLFAVHLLPALADSWNISVLVFTLMMGGFVAVLNHGGGMTALAARLLRGGRSKRRAGAGVFAMGWVLFIDGLANAMLVGRSMRPITDRVGMSREKLAFIVDSTSAPIAGLALISTWVAYELSVIREGLGNLPDPAVAGDVAPFELLVLSLPFRFYNVFLLLLVFLSVWWLRDFKSMAAAEARSLRDLKPAGEESGATDDRPWFWTTVPPLVVLVGGVFVGLFLEGGGAAEAFSLRGMINAFGRADAALVFVWATAFASLVAMFWSRRTGGRARDSVIDVFFRGMEGMFLPALILVFAWTLNSVIKDLGAAAYLVGWLDDRLHPGALPALVFLTGALISFSTGTSWGTMAILMPLAIPLAAGMSGAVPGEPLSPVIVAVIGAVLAGAVFGDHCSPISDTTIVSALASDCEPMAHVRTQLPYALVAAGAAVLLGYLPAGFGVSAWLLLPLGAAACWGMLRWRGVSTDPARSTGGEE